MRQRAGLYLVLFGLLWPVATVARAQHGRPVCGEAAALPAGTEAAYRLGRCLQEVERHEEALAALAGADTAEVRVRLAAAAALEALDRAPEALRHLEAARRLDPADRAVLAALARVQVASGRYREGSAAYAALLAADPQNPVLHARLGHAWLLAGRPDSAAAHFEAALRLQPRSPRVALLLASVYAAQERPAPALGVIDAALRADSTLPALWAQRGELALHLRDYGAAEAAFGRVLALGDTSVAVLRNRAIGLYAGGRFDEAARMLGLALARDTTDASAVYYMGLACLHLRRFDESARHLQAATRLFGQPLLGSVHGNLGAAYQNLRRDREAEAAYDLALRLNAADAQTRFRLATLYDYRLHDRRRAIRHYEAFLLEPPREQDAQMRAFAAARLLQLRLRLPGQEPPDPLLLGPTAQAAP